MGMASFINNEEQLRNEFIRLKHIFTQLTITSSNKLKPSKLFRWA